MTTPDSGHDTSAARATHSPLRSLLFVPADRPDRLQKALNSGADAVIVDLEDAVAPGGKAAARRSLVDGLAAPPEPGRPQVFVRLNPIRSRLGMEDLLALTDPRTPLHWDGLMLPKVDHAGDLRQVSDLLDGIGRAGALAALIETVEGVDNVTAIAGATRRLALLMFGGADLAADLRVALAWEPLVHARARVVAAAARFGLDAVDMPWIDLADEDGYLADLERSFALGFTARAAIHPRQIAPIHAALRPSPQEIERARRVIEAFAAADGGVCLLDGRLVERPVVMASRRIIALAEAAS